MPLTHICNSCGDDLTWIRATPDPHYGLPVVVCPGCDAACTRTKPAILNTTRAIRLSIRTALILALKVFMLMLLVTAMFGTLSWLADLTRTTEHTIDALTWLVGLDKTGVPYFRDPWEFRTPITVLIFLSIGAGAWLRGAHGHMHAITTLLLWLGILALTLSIVSLGFINDAVQNGDDPFRSQVARQFPSLMVYFALTLLPTLLGFLIGTQFRRAWIRNRTARLHRFRKKARKNRMNHARPSTA